MATQRQDSLTDQMRDVMRAAVEMGCYDAHDWIMRRWSPEVTERKERRYTHMPTLIADLFGTSRSEARRLIAQGGVKLDGKYVEDVDVPEDYLAGKELVVGKRRKATL